MTPPQKPLLEVEAYQFNELETIYRTAPIGLALIDKNFCFVRINDWLAEINGLSASAHIGRSIRQIVPGIADQAEHILRTVLQTGEAVLNVEFEGETSAQPGVRRVWNESWYPVKNSLGVTVAVTVSIDEVTERKKAEAALKQSEAEFRSLFDLSAVGVVQYDSATRRFVRANRRFCEIMGYSEEELRAFTFTDLTHPEDRTCTLEAVVPVLRGEQERWEIEKRYIRSDGRAVWVHVTGCAILDSDGKPSRTIASILDITARKQMEEKLRASEENYRAVIDSQGEMLCRFRLDGKILFLNAAYARARGATIEDLLGVNFWDFIPEADRSGVRAMLDRLTPEAPEVSIENRFQTAKGERWTLWTNRALAFDAKGRVTEAQSSGIDITDRKIAEQKLAVLNAELEDRVKERTSQLEEQTRRLRGLAAQLSQTEQKEKQRIAALLHDDLQQILTAGKIQLAQLNKQLTGRNRNDLAKGLTLIDQALSCSRSLTTQLSPPVEFKRGLQNAMIWLTRWMKEKMALEVQLNFHGKDRPLMSSEGHFIFHAVKELLLNVRKHACVNKAEMNVAFSDNGDLSISVHDSGRGFDNIGGGHTDETGFGLFNLMERLEMLGGSCIVNSTPGEGTSVTIRLPASSLPYPQSVQWHFEKRTDDRQNSSMRIGVLIVDDHQIMRQGLAELITDDPGMDVLGQASDGKQGVEEALRLRPRVVLMDVSMPHMDGIEATRAIKRELPETYVIGLSMHDRADKEPLMREAGASAYLSKSEAPEKIFEVIRTVCV